MSTSNHPVAVFSLASWESSFTYDFQQLLFKSHDKTMWKGVRKIWKGENRECYLGHLPLILCFDFLTCHNPPACDPLPETNGVKIQMPFNRARQTLHNSQRIHTGHRIRVRKFQETISVWELHLLLQLCHWSLFDAAKLLCTRLPKT